MAVTRRPKKNARVSKPGKSSAGMPPPLGGPMPVMGVPNNTQRASVPTKRTKAVSSGGGSFGQK